MPVFGYGGGILGNLVAFGQIRVKIIFPVKPAFFGNGAVCGQSRLNGESDRFLVQYRQHPGHTRAHRAGIGIRGIAESGGAGTENFGLGFELGVDLQADNRFELHKRVSLLIFFLIIDTNLFL
jgi:hypothetical protein